MQKKSKPEKVKLKKPTLTVLAVKVAMLEYEVQQLKERVSPKGEKGDRGDKGPGVVESVKEFFAGDK